MRQKFAISLLVAFAFGSSPLTGCKARNASTRLASEGDSTARASCDVDSIRSQMKELDSTEAELVLAQRLKFAIETGGSCTLPQVECQDECTSQFGGIGGFMFTTAHTQCLEQCQDAFNFCLKRQSESKGSESDTKKILASRPQLLQRREELLKALHLCTTDAAEARTLANETQYGLAKDQEWSLQSKIWTNLKHADLAVPATYRFIRGTAVDTPARRGYMSRSDWQKIYETDESLQKFGLKIVEMGVQGIDAYVTTMNAIFTAGMDVAASKGSLQDLEDNSIGSQHLVNIVKSCRNASDTNTAISCLGHRVQEVLSVRDNLDTLRVPEFTRDGRKFALCRHYAPTFAEACNLWAKEHGMSDKMKCETEAKISLLHAYPLISIQSEGKSYDYIYDLLNDPMTPDLVPISKASEDSVSVPNLSIARKDS